MLEHIRTDPSLVRLGAELFEDEVLHEKLEIEIIGASDQPPFGLLLRPRLQYVFDASVLVKTVDVELRTYNGPWLLTVRARVQPMHVARGDGLSVLVVIHSARIEASFQEGSVQDEAADLVQVDSSLIQMELRVRLVEHPVPHT